MERVWNKIYILSLHKNKETYIGSYTHVIKDLCGVMQCDENKSIRVKTYDKVL